MDASQILNQNLAPMLDAIRSYGQQIADQRKLNEQRDYQFGLRQEERRYQEGRTASDRLYQEELDTRTREKVFKDEAKKRRLENDRKIVQAFPGEDVSKMTDSQSESRAIEATRKITREDTLAKTDDQIRADAKKMGIAGFDTVPVTDLANSIADATVKKAFDAQKKMTEFTDQENSRKLQEPDGQKAKLNYEQLAVKKADLIRDLAFTPDDKTDPPVDRKVIGSKVMQLLMQGDMDTPLEQLESGKKMYEALTDPRNKDIQERVLRPILEGRKPATDAIAGIPGVTPQDLAYLSSLEAKAIADVTSRDPKMIQALASQGRNDSYLKKLEIGTTLNEINSEMKRLTLSFPALSKIPSIDMDALSNPKVKAPPGTSNNEFPMNAPVGVPPINGPSNPAAGQPASQNRIMPISESTKMFSDPSVQSIDPYSGTNGINPYSGTMVQPTPFPVNSSRFISPSPQSWKMDPQNAPITQAAPSSLSLSSMSRPASADGTIQYPAMIGDNGVGPFRGPVQNMPLPNGPQNYTPEQQFYLQLLQMSPDGAYGDFLRSKIGEKRY